MINGVALGFGLSELSATGEAVEEELGGGFLGTAAGITVDITNPFGLVEDISFFAALIDAAIEYVSGPDNQREEEDSGSQ